MSAYSENLVVLWEHSEYSCRPDELTITELKSGATGGAVYETIVRRYDAEGRVISDSVVTENNPPSASLWTAYEYDHRGNLVLMDAVRGDGTPLTRSTMTYDDTGNRLSLAAFTDGQESSNIVYDYESWD